MEFKYLNKVVVISGFYEGSKGKVENVTTDGKYLIRLKRRMEYFKTSELKLIQEE